MASQRDLAKQLFGACLSLESTERDAFLNDACSKDAELRSMVEALLSDSGQTLSFLQQSPLRLLEPTMSAVVTDANTTRAFDSSDLVSATSLAATNDVMSGMIGKAVGHFRIIEKLGSGGMGIVYKAQDLSLDRMVALKSLPPAAIDSKDAKTRLLQEAKTASVLDHPNICTIHQVLETPEGQLFITMSYYEGETVFQKLRNGPLPPQQALRIAADVALGLDKAHKHGVIHRDIKPGNIMVTIDGDVKILDFGLAILTSIAAARTGTTAGTISYMSPEQLRGEGVDQRTDIWAWGVLLFEMLTGHLPVGRKSGRTQMRAILSDQFELTEYINGAHLPQDISRVLGKALQTNPANRYLRITDALSDLNQSRSSEIDSKSGLNNSPGRGSVASIAVLPFRSLSSDPEDEYFSDGLNEELTNALTLLDGLFVASRTSVSALKGSMNRVDTANRLGVSFVLEGSVRRSGNRLRINVQLVKIDHELLLWSERFDREITDIFAVQEEIASKVADTLKVRIAAHGSPQLVKKYTTNLQAYNLYLKGRYQWNRESPVALFSAVETLRQAADADPSYVSPLCGLAECYLVMGARALLPPTVAWHKAKEATESALALDPTLADVHGCLGAVLAVKDFDWTAAEREFRHGLELNPDSALTRHWYAIGLLAPQGRLDEALSETSRSIEFEPLSLIYNSTLAWIYYLSHKWEMAVAHCSKTLEIDPHHFDSLWCLAATYRELGQAQDGMTILKTLDEVSGGIPLVYGSMGHNHALSGNTKEAEKMLLAVQESGEKIYSSPICESWIYANLPGCQDKALDCLEKALEDRDFLIRYIHLSPALKSLNGHPRFKAILRKMGLNISKVSGSRKRTLAVNVALGNQLAG
jgi:eukaryotic-like serine/threonine-protein kinase